MGTAYATVDDIRAIGRSLSAEQSEAAEVLIAQASAKLRITARKYGKNIDAMIKDTETGEDYALAVKSAVVQAVCRALDSAAGSTAVQQGTESIGAYSVTQIYANAGQSLYFLRNELKDLGILRQTFGLTEMYHIRTPEE